MKTVYELFLDFVRYELNFAACWVYTALTRGYLHKYDAAERFRHVDFTEEELAEIYAMAERDVLGIDRMKLYATPVDGAYAFYFARSPEEAGDLHRQIYGWCAKRWHSVYRQHMYTSLYYGEEVGVKNFQELKADVQHFPYYIGEWDGR